ncbi:hypothetical protein CLV59_108268 [Chitinophaga dinghuensis]|uniref:Uncharacterized protein n=1 Tax=Chitinophaga dinghuensis TaxID=1539050 RepID=A0A327VQU4_9BACT|nr:hypothetical protein [Chitinophaga dinghuensis]RAJ76747.1 hypothetical protein CLV59_108268 [Chitinophaga dinghuensis]
MENITPVQPFQVDITHTPTATITRFQTTNGVTHHGNLSMDGQSILATYVYHAVSYKLTYLRLHPDGNVTGVWQEPDGILPTLFQDPNGKIFVSIIPYHPDKEMEISIPLFDREAISQPKGNRPFSGHYIATVPDAAIFYYQDSFSPGKPDKMMAVTFRDNQVHKKTNIKIPLPSQNKLFIEGNHIRLLAREGKTWLLREINTKGEITHTQTIPTDNSYVRETLFLSRTQTSYLLTNKKGLLEIITLAPDGTHVKDPLFDLEDELYNTWSPEHIHDNIYITRFNTGAGNGWMITQENKLLEIYYSKGVQGYKNLLTGEVIPLPYEDVILSGLNKTTAGGYAVICYPRVERTATNNTLLIIHRTLQ